jgi:hypothetical protein
MKNNIGLKLVQVPILSVGDGKLIILVKMVLTKRGTK